MNRLLNLKRVFFHQSERPRTQGRSYPLNGIISSGLPTLSLQFYQSFTTQDLESCGQFPGSMLCYAVTSVVSDSVRPHRQQPTRLCRLWDSPGKNTGVGCHFLLHCMKVKSESEAAQSRPTPGDSMDCSPPGSSIHGIFQARVLEWGAIAFSGCTLQSGLISKAWPYFSNILMIELCV